MTLTYLRRVFTVAACALLALTAADAATIAVLNTNDASTGSLRQAIQDASPGDTIVFQIPKNDAGYNAATNVFTIGLTSNALVIGKNLTIDGGNQKIVVQGRIGVFGIFGISSGNVNLSNLTIANGHASSGAGIGLANSANLTLRNCTLYGNTTGSQGATGGAIASGGTLHVSNCTFTGNEADPGGSAIQTSSGDTTIDNSTFFSNNGNSAVLRLGSGTIRVRNTIIVGNNANTDVSGTFISDGYNLIGNTSAGGSGFGSAGDQVGVTAAQVNLGPLRDNGGPTLTLRPGAGSLAIDQGMRGLDANGQSINTDQRGLARPVDNPSIANATGATGVTSERWRQVSPKRGPTLLSRLRTSTMMAPA